MRLFKIKSLKDLKSWGWKNRFFGIVICLGIIIGAELWMIRYDPQPIDKKNELNILASQIIQKCKSDSNRPSCYDKEIPKLMDRISMEEAFGVTREVQNRDKSYQYCHVLGHELSAREVRKDPTKWKDVVTKCPSGMCSNGCIHGGFQEKFRSETLTERELEKVKPELANICENRTNWHPTGLEQASCYHAVGHLSMYVTNGEIDRSLKLCDELTLKSSGRDYRRLCYDGVFMQLFQPLEPDDFALVEGKAPDKNHLSAFCNQYGGGIKGSCLSEAWPLYREEIRTVGGLQNFCNLQERSEQKRCFSAMFYILASGKGLDKDKIAEFCRELPINLRGLCLANSASRMIEVDYRNIDQAIQLCQENSQIDPERMCYQEMLLYSGYNFKKDGSEFLKVCNLLPDDLKIKCLKSQTGTSESQKYYTD